MRTPIQTEFQNLACQKLDELAQRHQLTGYTLLRSGNGTEYKDYQSKTVFTVYHSRLDAANQGRLELAIGVENLTELTLTPEAVTAWLSRMQSTLHPANSKPPLNWPRLAVWSQEDVLHFCRGFESLMEETVNGSAIKTGDAPTINERLMSEILSRRGQAAFRSALLRAYEGQCAISGCTDIEVLEAAHIVPHHEERDYRTGNGLLLRADIHTLFDLYLLSVDPRCGKVVVSRHLGQTYQSFHGRELNLPCDVELHPDPMALMGHYKQWIASEQNGNGPPFYT